MSRKLIMILFSTGWLFILASCSPQTQTAENVVLILVEGLGAQDYICSNPRTIENLEALKIECPEFIRFTRAFAPSTLSQPVLASVMTGVTPVKHGVFHNGPLGVSGKMETLAEKALGKGYRTGFFSGGVPILNKFGIGQGFEIFDERKETDFQQGFRPVRETFQRGIAWLDNEVGEDAFFVSIYLPDLLYTKKATTNDLGDERSRVATSQVLEFYESLNEFVIQLKKRNRWEKTHFIVAGVSGTPGILNSSLDTISADKTQVTLQYRRASKDQEKAVGSYDKMISLRFIYNMIAKVFSNESVTEIVDYYNSLDSILTIRSDFGIWRKQTHFPSIGFRYKKYFFSYTPTLKVFDSFADASESSPLVMSEVYQIVRNSRLQEKLRRQVTDPCFIEQLAPNGGFEEANQQCGILALESEPDNQYLAKFLGLRWQTLGSEDEFVDNLSQWQSRKGSKRKPTVDGWLSQYYVRSEQWKKLLAIAKTSGHHELQLVAQKNLETEAQSKPENSCLSYFLEVGADHSNFYRSCDDSSLLKIIEGIEKLRRKEKPNSNFWREVKNLKEFRQVQNRNLDMMLINDVENTTDFFLKLSELYFYLPENKAFLKYLIDM